MNNFTAPEIREITATAADTANDPDLATAIRAIPDKEMNAALNDATNAQTDGLAAGREAAKNYKG